MIYRLCIENIKLREGDRERQRDTQTKMKKGIEVSSTCLSPSSHRVSSQIDTHTHTHTHKQSLHEQRYHHGVNVSRHGRNPARYFNLRLDLIDYMNGERNVVIVGT